MNGENQHGKNPMDDFKINTPENSLLSQQAVTSKGMNPSALYQPTVEPLLQYPIGLVLYDNLSFQCTTSST